jgi:hypothetical protein
VGTQSVAGFPKCEQPPSSIWHGKTRPSRQLTWIPPITPFKATFILGTVVLKSLAKAVTPCEQRFPSKSSSVWHVPCFKRGCAGFGSPIQLTRGWIVTARRRSKRISRLAKREYDIAMAMLEADFAGEERDYCSAAEEFRRQPPLECDLASARDRSAMASRGYGVRLPQFSGIQAAGR